VLFLIDTTGLSREGIVEAKIIVCNSACDHMESDYITNDAEVGEGWRGI